MDSKQMLFPKLSLILNILVLIPVCSSNLRKTYISWHNQVLGVDTGLVTNSADRNVLKTYYIDPKIMSVVEKAALEVRVFGNRLND